MKKTVMLIKISLFIFMILAFSNCFISCANFNPSITVGNNFNNINLLSGACDDENHVYFINKDRKIMKMSKKNGTVIDMGVSTHYLGGLNIVDGYLYLSSADYSYGDEITVTPCKISLNNMSDITYFNDYEKTGVSSFDGSAIIINDTIYFNGGFQKINKDGTANAADNDKPNRIFEIIGVDNNTIYAYIIGAEDNEVIVGDDGLQQYMTWIYKLSSDWKIKQKLFQICFESQYPLDENGSSAGTVIFTSTFDGYIYSIMPTAYDSERDGFCGYVLYRNRLVKDSEKEILHEFGNNSARMLAVTEDSVYFYYEDADNHFSSNIHRINHDGGNIKKLPYKYDFYNFDKEGYYFVSNINEKLYGIINNKILPIK